MEVLTLVAEIVAVAPEFLGPLFEVAGLLFTVSDAPLVSVGRLGASELFFVGSTRLEGSQSWASSAIFTARSSTLTE